MCLNAASRSEGGDEVDERALREETIVGWDASPPGTDEGAAAAVVVKRDRIELMEGVGASRRSLITAREGRTGDD
jgi:hypothetical protein